MTAYFFWDEYIPKSEPEFHISLFVETIGAEEIFTGGTLIKLFLLDLKRYIDH